MNNKYLVTGGAGFIGSNIVKKLLEKGFQVRIIDNFVTGSIENIKQMLPDIELIEGDICDYELLKNSMIGIDCIFHEAALPSVQRSIENPLASNQSNITGTLNVLMAAKSNGVRRVVYAASSSAYGNSLVLPKIEDMDAKPLSPYAITKYAGELYCRVFYQIYGLQTICLRYFNVFGPNQNLASQYAAVIPRFITNALNGKSLTIYGDGSQSRDFTYIDNVVNANLLAANCDKGFGEVFNIACGENIKLNDLIKKLGKILGKEIHLVYENRRKGDVMDSLAEISKAKNILNYVPTVLFDDALEKTVEWFKKRDI